MKIISNIELLKKERKPVAIAAGFFDGIHKGHKKVITETIKQAKKINGKAWLFTFDVHPASILNPKATPLLLTSNRHKLKLLKDLNLDGCILTPFTRKLAGLSPENFINLLCTNTHNLNCIFVGRNWRFGKNGAGNPALLSRSGKNRGFDVNIIRPTLYQGKPVSSTRIREQIIKGAFKNASAMLGRPVSILGKVVEGEKIGRELNYPTANINSNNEVLPPQGVYAVKANVNNKLYNGVLNYGIKPTFSGRRTKNPILELHLINTKQNLYDKEIEVMFVRKLRNEKAFSSRNNLIEQIQRDIEKAEKIFK